MKRTQLIALLLVVTVAVATIPAIAATEVQSTSASVVGAYRYTTLSAICVPTTPARYQTYTVYGWLKWSGTPLPYKYVNVYYKFPSQSTWKYLKTVKTNVNGRYSFSSSTSAAAVNWMIKFAGDSVYYPKTCYITVHTAVQTKIPTFVSFLAVPVAIQRGVPTAITYGVVAQGAGIHVNEPVSFFIDGTYVGQATLPPNSWSGVFKIPGAATSGLSFGNHKLSASYPGNAKYAPSTNSRGIYIM